MPPAATDASAAANSIEVRIAEISQLFHSLDPFPFREKDLDRRSNVWTYAGVNTFRNGRIDELSTHPTVKPVAMVADAMRDCSRRGDIVLDPFLGSGTTIMAAERVGRRGYGLELDPLYVDAAIRRWQVFTKRDAILKVTGQTFDEVMAARSSQQNPEDEMTRNENGRRSLPRVRLKPKTRDSDVGYARPPGNKAFAEKKNVVVWNKTNAGQGTFYRSQYELIFVFKVGNGEHINNFELGQKGRHRSNVWTYAGVNTFRTGRMDDLGAHPTVKPVALVADAMRDCSRRGDIILDPFMGSGTTIMAAERVDALTASSSTPFTSMS